MEPIYASSWTLYGAAQLGLKMRVGFTFASTSLFSLPLPVGTAPSSSRSQGGEGEGLLPNVGSATASLDDVCLRSPTLILRSK